MSSASRTAGPLIVIREVIHRQMGSQIVPSGGSNFIIYFVYLWNIQGLKGIVQDADVANLLNNYDFCMLCEIWRWDWMR